jgi:hypothetical protein
MRQRGRFVHPGVEHFGEHLRGSRFGHRMTREFYGYPSRSPHQRMKRGIFSEDFWALTAWKYRDEDHTQFSNLFLLVNRYEALVNFDLSMEYFASLEGEEFEVALQNVLAKGRTFKPVQSLPDWDGVPGVYVLVFDGYRQFYVGQAGDIRKRIKQHWGSRKSFDRLVYGSQYTSILPVDELRALDTTRIYAARRSDPFSLEQRVEAVANRRFCLNRMGGGEVTPLVLMLNGANPRARTYGITSVPLSFEGYQEAADEVRNAVARIGAGGPREVDQLLGLDLTIYSVMLEDGSQRFWSRRDGVAGAAIRGDLQVDDYAAFLAGIGETLIWPAD